MTIREYGALFPPATFGVKAMTRGITVAKFNRSSEKVGLLATSKTSTGEKSTAFLGVGGGGGPGSYKSDAF